MYTGVASIYLDLAGCRSLKDKRQIVRSIIERTRVRFQVAVAEVADQDLWQRATIGVACVSATSGHADEIIGKVIQFITTAHADAEILDADSEVLEAF